MKALSVKEIIDFKRKQDRGKRNFVAKMKSEVEKVETDKEPRDYWVIGLSAVGNVCKDGNFQALKDKIEEVERKLENAKHKIAQIQYQSNLVILNNYKDFDFTEWKPIEKIKFIKKQNINSILTIRGIEVKVRSAHVFTYKKGEVSEVGAIWFIAKKKGYRADELGIFAEVLYRYLKENYSEKYLINPKHCVAVDAWECFDVRYSQILDEEVPRRLNSTLDEIKKMM